MIFNAPGSPRPRADAPSRDEHVLPAFTGEPWSIAGKQPVLRAVQTPPGPEDLEPRRREHHVAILLALALLNSNDHPLAVNGRNRQVHRFRDAQAGGVAGREKDAMRGALDAACREPVKDGYHSMSNTAVEELWKWFRIHDGRGCSRAS